jgi:hypothetical protein
MGSVEESRVAFEMPACQGMSSEAEELQNNDKKGIRLWKEELKCDLKLQWDCYISVARIRLVKTENPSACERWTVKGVDQR